MAEQQGISVVGEVDQPMGRARFLRWLPFGIAGVLIVAGVVGAVVFFQSSATPPKSAAELEQQAVELAKRKQYTEAFKTFDQAASSTKDMSFKQKIYAEEYNTAVGAKRYDDELRIAQRALQAQKSDAAYASVAAAYESKGDTANAVKYYQLAVDYYNGHRSHYSNAGANSYQAKITQLKQGKKS